MNDPSAQSSDTKPPEALPMVPNRIRVAAQEELSRLDPFVASLTAEQWALASAARGWTVGDVVSHLNLALGLYARLLGAVSTGKGSGNVWKTVGDLASKVAPAAAPAFHAVNAAIPRLIDRTVPRETVQSQFHSAVETLQRSLDKLGPQDYNRQVYYVGGAWPLSFFLAAITNELGIHGWDMASALDPQAKLDFDARTVLPWFYWSGSPFMLRPPKGMSGTVQAVLRDPDSEMFWTLADGTGKGAMGRADNPSVTISADAGMFVLALAGRISPLDALRFNAVSVDGDTELARAFLGSWHLL